MDVRYRNYYLESFSSIPKFIATSLFINFDFFFIMKTVTFCWMRQEKYVQWPLWQHSNKCNILIYFLPLRMKIFQRIYNIGMLKHNNDLSFKKIIIAWREALDEIFVYILTVVWDKLRPDVWRNFPIFLFIKTSTFIKCWGNLCQIIQTSPNKNK